MDGKRSLRLQAARASGACRVRPAVPERHASLALFAPSARARAPWREAPLKATDTVTVNYEGRLTDGTVFDSSMQRGGPATVPLNKGQQRVKP